MRRIFAALRLPLLRLVRSEFAGVRLEGLAPGAWRELTPSEIQKLAGLSRNEQPKKKA